jgi:HPt (histidine-containing phosphotransfer) domain-containing protein
MEDTMEISQETISRYLRNRKDDLRKCREFLEAKNFEDLERIGHQLKGNGSTFGFPELSQLGMELEFNAKKKEPLALKTILEKYSKWLGEKI